MKKILALVLALLLCTVGAAFAEAPAIDEAFPFTPDAYEPMGYTLDEYSRILDIMCTEVNGVTNTWNEQPTVLENGYSYYTTTGEGMSNVDVLVDSANNVLAIRVSHHVDANAGGEAIYQAGVVYGQTLPAVAFADDATIKGDVDTSIVETMVTEITTSMEPLNNLDASFILGKTFVSTVNGRTLTTYVQTDLVTALEIASIVSK